MTDKPAGFFQGTDMPNAGWWEALWPDPADVLTRVGVKSGMDVIDLCSDDGWFTLQIAKLARRVVAIDMDPALLEVARHRLRESRLGNCHFVTGDAYDIARVRFQEVGEDGKPAFAPSIGTLYIRKSALADGKIPQTLTVTITI